MSKKQIFLLVFVSILILFATSSKLPLYKKSALKSLRELSTEPIISPALAIFPTIDYRKIITVKVIRVIDGDTMEIDHGDKVRFIGINSPEAKDPRKGLECYSQEAYEKTKELLEGKTVILETDISERDVFGRKLAYVWLEDVLINQLLIAQGYAQSSTYPPDVKYQQIFLETQQKAKKERKGLWGNECNNKVYSRLE